MQIKVLYDSSGNWHGIRQPCTPPLTEDGMEVVGQSLRLGHASVMSCPCTIKGEMVTLEDLWCLMKVHNRIRLR